MQISVVEDSSPVPDSCEDLDEYVEKKNITAQLARGQVTVFFDKVCSPYTLNMGTPLIFHITYGTGTEV